MSWEITYHAEEPENPKVGDMWPAPDWAMSNIISENYRALKGARPPLMMLLPSKNCKEGDRFLVDRKAFGTEAGWKVVINGQLIPGQKPNITISPSVNCEGSYHGHIKNGVITDDVEGREYT